MSKHLITFTFAFTTAIITYLWNKYVKTKNKNDETDEKLEVIFLKIRELEYRISSIQSSIEDLENNLSTKNNKIIESNIALNSKLDDFINYTYDVYDDD